jgi:hypothetical protein
MDGKAEPKYCAKGLGDDFHRASISDGSASIENSYYFGPVIRNGGRTGFTKVWGLHQRFEAGIEALLGDVDWVGGGLDDARKDAWTENKKEGSKATDNGTGVLPRLVHGFENVVE